MGQSIYSSSDNKANIQHTPYPRAHNDFYFFFFGHSSVIQWFEDISYLGCAVAVTVNMEVGRRLREFIHVALD